MKKIIRIAFFIFIPFTFNSCSRSPENIFEAVFGEISETVQVKHSQDQLPLDCCIWLHFTIAKSDLTKIINDFSESDLDYKKWKAVLPPKMDWWNPQKFKKKGFYLEKESDREIEGIYINQDKNEAFYVNWLK